jgi:hypothetical protein
MGRPPPRRRRALLASWSIPPYAEGCYTATS